MSEAPRKEIPRPKGDDDFEDLVLALFRAVWMDSGAKLNGRRGQRQDGVDLYGTDYFSGSRRTGVPCKQHATATLLKSAQPVRRAPYLSEEGKVFPPPLDHFILVTTAKRSGPVQEEARNIT